MDVLPLLTTPATGHEESRMVERVYGPLPIDDLARRIAQQLRKDSGQWLGRNISQNGSDGGTCSGNVVDHGESGVPWTTVVLDDALAHAAE